MLCLFLPALLPASSPPPPFASPSPPHTLLPLPAPRPQAHRTALAESPPYWVARVQRSVASAFFFFLSFLLCLFLPAPYPTFPCPTPSYSPSSIPPLPTPPPHHYHPAVSHMNFDRLIRFQTLLFFEVRGGKGWGRVGLGCLYRCVVQHWNIFSLHLTLPPPSIRFSSFLLLPHPSPLPGPFSSADTPTHISYPSLQSSLQLHEYHFHNPNPSFSLGISLASLP